MTQNHLKQILEDRMADAQRRTQRKQEVAYKLGPSQFTPRVPEVLKVEEFIVNGPALADLLDL